MKPVIILVNNSEAPISRYQNRGPLPVHRTPQLLLASTFALDKCGEWGNKKEKGLPVPTMANGPPLGTLQGRTPGKIQKGGCKVRNRGGVTDQLSLVCVSVWSCYLYPCLRYNHISGHTCMHLHINMFYMDIVVHWCSFWIAPKCSCTVLTNTLKHM